MGTKKSYPESLLVGLPGMTARGLSPGRRSGSEGTWLSKRNELQSF